MNKNFSIALERYLDNSKNSYDTAFLCDILENYTLSYIENYANGYNNGEEIVIILGQLAFLYKKDEIVSEKVIKFIDKIFNKLYYINHYLARHISNFIEIVSSKDVRIIESYILQVEKYNRYIEKDNVSILYKGCILPLLRKKMPVGEFVEKFKYPWRSYYELSHYYYHYDNGIASLKYIIKAIKTCPKDLLREYKIKREYLKSKFVL